MQTYTAQSIIQKVPMLTEEQQKTILEITESFLSDDSAKEAWAKIGGSISENEIDSNSGEFAEHTDDIH
ncbi:MAG: hypothetical protein ACT4O9_02765 [Blastocatellia bacterium]